MLINFINWNLIIRFVAYMLFKFLNQNYRPRKKKKKLIDGE